MTTITTPRHPRHHHLKVDNMLRSGSAHLAFHSLSHFLCLLFKANLPALPTLVFPSSLYLKTNKSPINENGGERRRREGGREIWTMVHKSRCREMYSCPIQEILLSVAKDPLLSFFLYYILPFRACSVSRMVHPQNKKDKEATIGRRMTVVQRRGNSLLKRDILLFKGYR